MHGVSTSTRKELLALAPVLMTKLECMLEKSDPRRTGVLNLQSFEVAVQRAQFFVSKQAFGVCTWPRILTEYLYLYV
jgi:hypothetical protein